MRNSSNYLFDLIKSLSRTEKGYFKKFSKKDFPGEQDHIVLFDIIDSQTEYDEELLKKKFTEYDVNNNKQLPRIKNYLYDSILKSLRSYYDDSSINTQLRDALKNADILYNRALYDQCSKILSKAKTLARENEKYLILNSIFEMESKILKKKVNPQLLKELMQEGAKEQLEILDKVRNIIEYINLNNQMTLMKQEKGHYVRTEEDRTELEKIMSSPLMKNENKAITYRSKFYFYHIQHLYYEALEKDEKAYLWAKKGIELMESNPQQMNDDIYNYISLMSNLLLTQTALNKKSEFDLTIEKLRAIKHPNEDINAYIFQQSYTYELLGYLSSNDFERAVNIVPDIEDGLKRYKGKLSKMYEFIFYNNISQAYFGVSNYKKALEWINKIVNNPDMNIMEDLQCLSRMYYLIIHYELDNLEFIEYSVPTVFRFLEKKRQIYQFETLVLNKLKKICKLPDKTTHKALLLELRDEIEKLRGTPSEKVAFDYFDIPAWVESKINNTSFEKSLKEAERLKRKRKAS